jgi:hypothetical protein
MADTAAATPRKKPKKLTPISVANLRPSDKRREVPDGGCAGLYRVLQPSGATSWAVRYRVHGQQRKITLAGSLMLAAARREAAAALHQVEQGNDPSEQRKAAKAKAVAAREDTVQAVCEQYLKREGTKLRTGTIIEAILKRHVYPTLGRRQIDSIKRSEITRLIDKIEDRIKDDDGEYSGERTADLVLSDLRRVFHWHEKRTDEFRSPIIRGMGRYNIKEHARSRVLDDDELKKLWAASEAAGPFNAFVRFLLLTTARRSEASGLPWSEIDDNGVWSLPAARNKTKLDLIRPLSKPAQDLIAAQPRLGPYVFSFDGNHQLTVGRAMHAFREKCGIAAHWTIHDIRRTARTLMSRAGVNADHAERCLGHLIGGVRATYDPHEFFDEKKIAFETLASLIERIVNPPGDTVVPMIRRQR